MKLHIKDAFRIISVVMIFLAVLYMTCTMSGCSAASSINASLSDLGGVYSSRFSDLDLKKEISGRLVKDEEPDDAGYGEGLMPRGKDISVSGEILSNKVLRWGYQGDRKTKHRPQIRALRSF
jgi:hypothetical protein